LSQLPAQHGRVREAARRGVGPRLFNWFDIKRQGQALLAPAGAKSAGSDTRREVARSRASAVGFSARALRYYAALANGGLCQIRPTTQIGEATIDDWKSAGLLRPSVIKPVVATIARQLVRKRLGHLATPDIASLKQALAAIIGG
jgi:hypothetical protein